MSRVTAGSVRAWPGASPRIARNVQRYRRLRRAALGVCLLGPLVGAPTPADPGLWDSLSIHGFAAQAAVRTSANRWFGDSTATSFEHTELAVNASLSPVPRLLLAGQILARRAGAMYDGTPALDYALADIGLLASRRGRAGLRLGRIKNPLGLYNETRDVPFTHPGIFLPQVVYFDKVRNLALSSDGAMIYGELYRDLGTLSVTVGNGRAVIDGNVEWTYLSADFAGEVEPAGNTWLASLWYSDASERLKLGWSGAKLSTRFDPSRGARFTLDPGTTDILYWIASFQYSGRDWTLVSEYAREPLVWSGYGPFFPDVKLVAEGYYVQGTWRPLARLELMLRYEEGFADRQDRGGRVAAVASGGLFNAVSGYSKILSAGLRWDIDPHWMVRAEYGHHRGTFVLSPRENSEAGGLRGHWELWALQVVFRF